MREIRKNLSPNQIIIVLGASGLIGQTVSDFLSKKMKVFRVFREKRVIFDAHDIVVEKINFEILEKLIRKYKPNFIINCIGLTKHLAGRESDLYFYPNVLIPRYLKMLKYKFNFNLMHISSDCVFRGDLGNYKESSYPDATDYYGMTKAISETDLEKVAMILRTSTVGYEKHTKNGLVEWFLNSDKNINGYSKAFFNGVTTLELSMVIFEIISGKIKFQNGIFHVTSNVISKYEFLTLMNQIHNAGRNILKEKDFVINRTLHKSEKISALDRSSKSWKKMILEMKENRDNGFLK